MNGDKHHVFRWTGLAFVNLRRLTTSMLRLCGGQQTPPQNSAAEEQNPANERPTKPPDALQGQRHMSVTSSGRDGIFTVEIANEESLKETMMADGYILGPTIGQGAFGKVRHAVIRTPSDPDPGRSVACKIIDKLRKGPSGVVPCTYVRKHLPRELDVMRKARHPHVIKTHIIYMSSSSVYVFMDYCKMGDLMKYIENEGPLSYRTAQLFFKQLCDAVEYLHDKGIAHRDIKCENILLENWSSIKLTDFGFARMCADEEGRRVKSDTFCGTRLYAAPEILRGKSYYPKVSDVWAMGVVLYRMLADCFPFSRNSRDQIVANQMARQYNRPLRHLNEDMRSLFSIMCEPDVTKRATVKRIKKQPWLMWTYRL